MKPLRLGFIGAGGIAQRHLQALQHFDDVTITAISSRTPANAQALARQTGRATQVYSDYAVMLDRAALDALYICVPPFAHGEYELAAVNKDLPFFVEKPLSANRETAENILAAVQARRLITAVGYQWRYLDTTDLARQLLQKNPAGLALGYWLDKLPPPVWWSETSLSGGQMVEQTTHIFDLARWLVGEIDQVFALGAPFAVAGGPPPQVDTISTATVRFENGAAGNFSSTCLLNGLYGKGLQLFSAGQALELSYQSLIIDQGPDNRRVEQVKVDPFVLEDRDFLDAVAGRPNLIRSDYAEAMRTHRVTQAALRSIREQRPVMVAE